MENLNEVIQKKHVIRKNGLIVIKTNDLTEANDNWTPAKGEHWVWERNGEKILEEKDGI